MKWKVKRGIYSSDLPSGHCYLGERPDPKVTSFKWPGYFDGKFMTQLETDLPRIQVCTSKHPCHDVMIWYLYGKHTYMSNGQSKKSVTVYIYMHIVYVYIYLLVYISHFVGNLYSRLRSMVQFSLHMSILPSYLGFIESHYHGLDRVFCGSHGILST